MSIYLDEKNPEKHKPFDDASPDIVAYVRYLLYFVVDPRLRVGHAGGH